MQNIPLENKRIQKNLNTRIQSYKVAKNEKSIVKNNLYNVSMQIYFRLGKTKNILHRMVLLSIKCSKFTVKVIFFSLIIKNEM